MRVATLVFQISRIHFLVTNDTLSKYDILEEHDETWLCRGG